jgi:hypothetical protein
LRRLGRTVDAGVAKTGPAPAGIAVSGGLFGVGGVLGGIAGWQGSEFQQGSAAYQQGERSWDETEAIGTEASAAGQRATGLGLAAAGLGVGGAVALVVTLAQGPSNAPVAVVAPTAGGLAVSIGGRW